MSFPRRSVEDFSLEDDVIYIDVNRGICLKQKLKILNILVAKLVLTTISFTGEFPGFNLQRLEHQRLV